MVLAAGKGTRLFPLTGVIPKPMAPVAGKPMIQHIFELLARTGVEEVHVNVHYLADVILDYYPHQKYFVIQGTYNGVPNTNMVLTGSSNWASLGTAEDEVFFTIQGRTNAKRYLANFNSFWNSGRFSRNAYTTTYTDFKVARMVRQAEGPVPGARVLPVRVDR